MTMKRSDSFETADVKLESANTVPQGMDESDEDEGIQDIRQKASDVMYLAQETRKQNKLPDSKLKRLKKLKVQLQSKVLPQHKVERYTGTRVPSKAEQKEFEKYAKIKKGYFTSDEDSIIVSNWKAFCALHNWKKKDVQPFLHLHKHIPSKEERRKFLQFLANGLPNRTLYSISNRFHNLYNRHRQEPYTPEEDEQILEHLENNPHLDKKRKFVDLAIVLNRTRASLWRRYRLLRKKFQMAEEGTLEL